MLVAPGTSRLSMGLALNAGRSSMLRDWVQNHDDSALASGVDTSAPVLAVTAPFEAEARTHSGCS